MTLQGPCVSRFVWERIPDVSTRQLRFLKAFPEGSELCGSECPVCFLFKREKKKETVVVEESSVGLGTSSTGERKEQANKGLREISPLSATCRLAVGSGACPTTKSHPGCRLHLFYFRSAGPPNLQRHGPARYPRLMHSPCRLAGLLHEDFLTNVKFKTCKRSTP